MRTMKEVLRLKLEGQLSHQQIAAALGISKGVVTKYVGLAAASGLNWPQVRDMDDVALERRLLVAPERPRDHVQPDYGRLHQELRRKGMTLMLLWEEYRADHASEHTYGYTQFCENYRRFARQLKRSMRQVHRAGEKLFIDYAGPTIGLTDGTHAHVFVAAMGASSYTYACATPRETMVDWLESTARALSFYGGVPQLIVPDNPRALISDANRYVPRSNDTVLDFARHYGTSILPARPYHPQDKAKAESAVQIVERWIMARLRHQQFASVHEVSVTMAPLLARLNEKPFQKLPGSRASTFAAIDAPALHALPLQRYEMAHFKTVKAHIDYHVEVERHRYRVPHALVGQVLEARVTVAMVELLHRGQRSPATPGTAASAALPRWLHTCRQRTVHTWSGRRSDSLYGARASVRRLCKVLEVHPSGFYAWRLKPEGRRAKEDKRLQVPIKQSWLESGSMYGYRKVCDDLRELDGLTIMPSAATQWRFYR